MYISAYAVYKYIDFFTGGKNIMVKNLGKRILPVVLAVLLVMSVMPFHAFAATTVKVLDDQISITDTATNMSESGGVVTVTAKGGRITATTNTITITNETESTVKLTFSYSASGYSTFSESSASGIYDATLDAGGSVTMSIKGTTGLFGYTNGVLTLSNFSLVVASSSSNVTFNYDSTYGSITADGEAVADGGIKEIALSGAALVATPVSGATFLGWVNEADNQILSTATSYTVKPAQDMAVKAIFIGANSAPHFMIGGLTPKTFSFGLLGMQKGTYYTVSSGTHLFDNLAEAAAASAASVSSKGIVLMNSGTLPAGDYTIPAGSTLLIPFDNANTLYTTISQGREHSSSEVTSHSYKVYRKLTMADGANIVINGAMSLSAKHLYGQGNRTGGGSPVDDISQVEMKGNSSITVNNGGKLYVYGYIYGSGSVTAKSGAEVYENFQIMDFRGGTQSTDMKNGVFPFSQYYIQNIEVPMKLEYGAKEYSLTTIFMSSAAFTSAVNFIGPSNSMFNLSSGYVTKRYDGATDRLIVELNGTLDVSSVKMEVGTSSINSKDYELPINSNLSITAKSGSSITMNQDIAMLPGSEIIVEKDATCTIGSGINVYIYDADNWGVYSGAGTDTTFKPVTHAMSRTYNRTNADLVDAKIQVDGTINASAGYVYTTAFGANVCSSGTGVATVTAGTQETTHQFIYTGAQYVAIPITPVKFKNADNSYLQSATGNYVYKAEHEKWAAEAHTFDEGVTVEPTCEENGYTRYTCVCGYYYDDNIVQATGHECEMVVIEPTCTKEGKKYEKCTICQAVINEEVLPTVDHVMNEVTTAPTCTEAGSVVKSCENCDFVETTVIEATGHSYKSEVTAPTCTTQGYTTHTCTVCGDTKIDTYVDPTGHSYGNWTVRTQAGCESEGVEYRTCSVCGNEETRAIDAKGHSYSAVVTEPTCTEQGYTTYTCTVCDHSYVADEVAAKGHDYNAVVTAPTCTEQGYTTYTCTVCTYSYVDNYVAPTGHNMSDWIIDTEAGCETDGAKHKECSACDYVEKETISAIGHAYSSVVTAPTCTEQGYTTHTCANCGNSYVDNYVDALGHSFGNWETIEDPTHTENGLKKRVCHCGDEETETIPMIICDYNGDGEVNATELAMMRKFLVETLVPDDKALVLFDMNDDGIISVKDLVRLKKYIAGIKF